jgi:hypothetical protein
MPLTTYTAGEVLTAASLNANFSFAAAGGLSLISTTTIGSAVGSVTVSNAFSATYDTYKITVTGGVGSAVSTLKMTLGATTSDYYAGIIYMDYPSSTVGGIAGSNTASWVYAGSGDTASLDMNCELRNPFNTKVTHISSFSGNGTTTNSTYRIEGMLNNATSYTAFTLTPSTGTITGGTIRVYGYRNS